MAEKYDTNTTANELVQDFASDINNKIILTTGVTPGGLGAAFVEAIAKGQPSILILTGRTPNKAQKTSDTITAAHPDVKIRVLKLELVSLAAVREAAETVNSWNDVPHIDVLVNNAGLMGTSYMLTADGFESQFGTNHVGHFLFTNLIMEKLMASASPRVVNITSDGHRLNPIRWFNYNFSNGETYNKWHGYGQSKIANMLMILSLAQKLGSKGLLAYSVHPIAVEGSNLGAYCDWEVDRPLLQSSDKALGNPEGWATGFDFKTQQRGVAIYVYAAFDPNLKDHNGAYLLNSGVGNPWKDTIKPWATSSVEAKRLWKLSEKLIGQKFTY